MIHLFIISLIILLNILSCSPLTDYRQLLDRDIQPPSFLGIKTEAQNSMEVLFSEPVVLNSSEMFIVPGTPPYTATPTDNGILFKFNGNLAPGKGYKLKMSVKDKSGNTLTLINSFYGYNPDLPKMVINEFTTQGTAANPDRVEIAVLSDGNTAGAVIYEGSDYSWEQRKILPAINVNKGDFIIVHFKSTGDPLEIDETEVKDQSGGVRPSDEAWDIWVDGGTGLSGNNGTIMLFSALYGRLIDGILYSNRTSLSDENYRGFGSTRVMERADRLCELSGWDTAGELAAPEDGINPEDSTATRSMCRDSVSRDSNSKKDWHIVPTSTSTFGSINSEETYVP